MEPTSGIPRLYNHRHPEKTVLYDIVRRFSATFFAERELEGRSVPSYIKKEFDNYLRCGILAYGFVRVACTECTEERIVPFSCKGRGLCVSCMSRRMAEVSLHIDDNVIPEVPTRQFVLTLPVPVRLWAARNKELLSKICSIAAEQIEKHIKMKAGFEKKDEVYCGMINFVQRFGSALNLNIHMHVLAIDGAFQIKSTGRTKFYHAKSPTDNEVGELLQAISKRVNKYLVKKRFLEVRDEVLIAQDTSSLFEQDDMHLPAMAASLASKIAFGRNSGQCVKRLYANGRLWPSDTEYENTGDRCAASGGYTLHANTAIKAEDRERLKHLIRYMARPSVSDERIELLPDDNVRIKLKTAWSDGSTHIELSALETMEKLVALVPLPKFHLLRYYGVLSPHAKYRSKIVPAPKNDNTASEQKAGGVGTKKRRYYSFAELLKRTFAIDILVCVRCGAKMAIKCIVEDVRAITDTLVALGLDPKPPDIFPAMPTTVFSEGW